MSDYVLINVKVVPGSSNTALVGWLGDALKLRVTANAEKGKANQAVVELLAVSLDLPAEHIDISSGASSPRKVVRIRGLSEAEITKRLSALLD